jgi:Rieske Fe-S protein
VSGTALTRRSALRGAGVMAIAAVVGYVVAARSDAATAAGPATAANGYGPKAPSGRAPLAKVSDIPAGGGIVLGGADIVLVREPGGGVRGFSATCTHQGCRVSSVQDGVISCPCHGSRFSAADGSVESGPATRPLPPVAVTVRSGAVYASKTSP